MIFYEAKLVGFQALMDFELKVEHLHSIFITVNNEESMLLHCLYLGVAILHIGMMASIFFSKLGGGNVCHNNYCVE